MKKYWKVIAWAILLLFSAIALVVAVVCDRTVQIVPSLIAIVFTAVWVIVEVRNAKGR